MITPEQLIYDLQQENAKLQQELYQAEIHITDFELAAKEWKKGYGDMEKKLKIKIKELEQIVEELESEIKNLKRSII